MVGKCSMHDLKVTPATHCYLLLRKCIIVEIKTSLISDNTTSAGDIVEIILLWTTWFDKPFIKRIGIGPITCGPNKKKRFLTGDKNLYSNSSAVVFDIVEGDLLKTFISACSMSQQTKGGFSSLERNNHECIYEYYQFIPYSRSLFNWTMTYKYQTKLCLYIVSGRFKGSYDSNRKYLENSIKTAFVFISNGKFIIYVQ